MFATTLDQASGLRRLFEKQATTVIAFASTQRDSSRIGDRVKVMMQIAADLGSSGQSVAIFDEHPAPGGIAHAYGVSSRKDFKHVLHGDYLLDEIMLNPAPGLGIIPASRAAGMEFSLADEASLAGNIAMLRNKKNCIMVDCVHRTQRVLSPIASHADQIFAIVPANNEHLPQAYSLIKRITQDKGHPPISVVVVHAADAGQAKTTFDKLQRVALDHLGITLQYQGAAMTPGVSCLPIGQARRMAPSSIDDSACFSGFPVHLGIAGSVV